MHNFVSFLYLFSSPYYWSIHSCQIRYISVFCLFGFVDFVFLTRLCWLLFCLFCLFCFLRRKLKYCKIFSIFFAYISLIFSRITKIFTFLSFFSVFLPTFLQNIINNTAKYPSLSIFLRIEQLFRLITWLIHGELSYFYYFSPY